MPPLLLSRQERFCQLLAEGMSQTEAYRLAGYRDHRANASVLKQQQSIQDRVAELIEEKHIILEHSRKLAAAEEAVDKGWLIRQLKDAADIARRKDDPSGLVAAAREIGVLTGERIEKSEHGRPGEFAAIEAMSRAELEASIVKLVRQIEDEPKLLAPPTDD